MRMSKEVHHLVTSYRRWEAWDEWDEMGWDGWDGNRWVGQDGLMMSDANKSNSIPFHSIQFNLI